MCKLFEMELSKFDVEACFKLLKNIFLIPFLNMEIVY